MSGTIIAVLVNLFVILLPLFNIHIASEDLQRTIETITALVTGIWIWVQHVQLQQQANVGSRINIFGGIKK